MCSFHACYSCVLQFTFSPTLTPTTRERLKYMQNDPVLSDCLVVIISTYIHPINTAKRGGFATCHYLQSCKSVILIVFKHTELHFERMLEAAPGIGPRIVIKTMDESPLDGHCVIIIPGILHHLFSIASSPVVSRQQAIMTLNESSRKRVDKL